MSENRGKYTIQPAVMNGKSNCITSITVCALYMRPCPSMKCISDRLFKKKTRGRGIRAVNFHRYRSVCNEVVRMCSPANMYTSRVGYIYQHLCDKRLVDATFGD